MVESRCVKVPHLIKCRALVMTGCLMLTVVMGGVWAVFFGVGGFIVVETVSWAKNSVMVLS